MALGPVSMAALTTFGSEHLSAAPRSRSNSSKMDAVRLFVAIVGVALLAAGLSLVAKGPVRRSAICLAMMFAPGAWFLVRILNERCKTALDIDDRRSQMPHNKGLRSSACRFCPILLSLLGY